MDEFVSMNANSCALSEEATDMSSQLESASAAIEHELVRVATKAKYENAIHSNLQKIWLVIVVVNRLDSSKNNFYVAQLALSYFHCIVLQGSSVLTDLVSLVKQRQLIHQDLLLESATLQSLLSLREALELVRESDAARSSHRILDAVDKHVQAAGIVGNTSWTIPDQIAGALEEMTAMLDSQKLELSRTLLLVAREFVSFTQLPDSDSDYTLSVVNELRCADGTNDISFTRLLEALEKMQSISQFVVDVIDLIAGCEARPKGVIESIVGNSLAINQKVTTMEQTSKGLNVSISSLGGDKFEASLISLIIKTETESDGTNNSLNFSNFCICLFVCICD
jgi:hypothetical protein